MKSLCFAITYLSDVQFDLASTKHPLLLVCLVFTTDPNSVVKSASIET
jgi:hypothetical protein